MAQPEDEATSPLPPKTTSGWNMVFNHTEMASMVKYGSVLAAVACVGGMLYRGTDLFVQWKSGKGELKPVVETMPRVHPRLYALFIQLQPQAFIFPTDFHDAVIHTDRFLHMYDTVLVTKLVPLTREHQETLFHYYTFILTRLRHLVSKAASDTTLSPSHAIQAKRLYQDIQQELSTLMDQTVRAVQKVAN
jgi:hypothetical protein